MTALAGRAQLTFVRVGVARRARGLRIQERPARVTGGAFLRRCRVHAVEGEAGDRRVLEGGLIERPQLAVASGVLDVTLDAVSLYVFVDADFPEDAIRNRFVAGQTAIG